MLNLMREGPVPGIRPVSRGLGEITICIVCGGVPLEGVQQMIKSSCQLLSLRPNMAGRNTDLTL